MNIGLERGRGLNICGGVLLQYSMHVSRKRIRFLPIKSFIERYRRSSVLGKSSVLMMLLLGTASFVGLSSIYTPANVETQPQPKIPQNSLIIPQSKLADPQVLRAIEENQLLKD